MLAEANNQLKFFYLVFSQVSIMQISSDRTVFILDLLKLSLVAPDILDSSLKRILQSPRILKLGMANIERKSSFNIEAMDEVIYLLIPEIRYNSVLVFLFLSQDLPFWYLKIWHRRIFLKKGYLNICI